MFVKFLPVEQFRTAKGAGHEKDLKSITNASTLINLKNQSKINPKQAEGGNHKDNNEISEVEIRKIGKIKPKVGSLERKTKLTNFG